MSEHPKALYRGDDWLIVPDAEAELVARGQGWGDIGQHPLDHDGDGEPGGSLPDAVAPRKRGRPRKQ
jgi:hypothetical protein